MRSRRPRASRSAVTTPVTTSDASSSHQGGRPAPTARSTGAAGLPVVTGMAYLRRTAPLVTAFTVPARDRLVISPELDPPGRASGHAGGELLERGGEGAVDPRAQPGPGLLVRLGEHLAVPVHPGDEVPAVVGHEDVDLDVGVRQPGGDDLTQLVDAVPGARRYPDRTGQGPAQGQHVVLGHGVDL